MAKVTLQNLRKEYPGGVIALRDFTLTIEDGEFITLVGPSGCGKSTTLNLIAGLDVPTAGTIRIGDRVVNDEAPRERDIAMVFQDYALYPHMDVRRNISFPLKFSNLGRNEIKKCVQDTAAKLGLEDLLDRKPKELSGGQKQRVALARALVRNPKAFLFDEPLSNLDPALRVELRAELKRLHAALNATFVYVTHDQSEAMTLSDRVVVLNNGTLQQVGKPSDIYSSPANTFVANFFGWPRINLIKAAQFPKPVCSAVPDGIQPVIGVRPEDVEFGIKDPPDDAEPVVVDLVEPVGAESWLTLRLADVTLRSRAPVSMPVSSGDNGWVRLSPDKLHLFDEESGVRLGHEASVS